MPLAVALLCVCTAPAPAHGERVLVADVKGENVDAAALVVIRDAVTTALARSGVEVVSLADARNLVDVDADRAAAGCDEAAAHCQAELAQALGARFVVFGTAARVDGVTVIHFALTDASRAVVVARSEVEASATDDLVARVKSGAADLAAHLDRGPSAPTIAAATVGAVAALGAIGATIAGVVDNAAINDRTLSPQRRKDAEDGRNIAYVVAASSAAVAVAGGIAAWVLE